MAWSIVPGSVAAGIGAVVAAARAGVDPSLAALVATFATFAWVASMERVLPYRRDWNRSHGDVGTDSLYMLTQFIITAALTPFTILTAIYVGGWLSGPIGLALWPTHWPIPVQVVLATVVREFFDYWAHRAMHHFDWMWRMHATHHSVPRLYWLNNSRAHPGEIAFRFAIVGVLPLALLGAGNLVLALTGVAAIVADTFQHANIAFRLGPLSWLYSIGDLHRWHHSRDRREADRNFGNVYIFWDVVFGTRFLPSDREPPRQLGIEGMDAFPRKFFAQWMSPFRWARIERESAALRRRAPGPSSMSLAGPADFK